RSEALLLSADSFQRNLNGTFTPSAASPVYAQAVMRRAFVVQLGPETQTSRQHFVGQIEEVDTGRETRFRSTEELLTFLSDCYDRAERRDSGHHEDDEGNSKNGKVDPT